MTGERGRNGKGARGRARGVWLRAGIGLALLGALALSVACVTAERALRASLLAPCAPLQVVDRFGQVLRERAARCGEPRRGHTLAVSAMPGLLSAVLVAAEDRRFAHHFGVDALAVVRALGTDMRAGRRVSGASTLSMQLARMLRPRPDAHSLRAKLAQALDALVLERMLTKSAILTEYLNRAYYGGGAYGIVDAAGDYFGKSVAELSAGEASLLAILPRAPARYDPRRELGPALKRRAYVLAQMVARGQLSDARRSAIEAEPLALAPAARSATPGGHFVDWVLGEVPEAERRSGGVLYTTLDRDLQRQLESAVVEHVARLAHKGIEQAGLVVLDADSSEVRALVGSRAYASSQLDIVTRRRQLGSLLKPFAYALAIEAGASPGSVALDVGDVESEYRVRDWVGHEAGPLSYREALSGSYNLAAVHVLEGVGVAALHERLRRAGVAELKAPPARYGLGLVLGTARVRLLDLVAGYGFLVRDGRVRRARGMTRLDHPDGTSFRAPESGETRVFAPGVSWLVMEMLSDPAARHRRFGRGLPVDTEAPIVAKTGTASGMSDVSAIVASRELIVGAWAGRFDGTPTRGMSGMWGAAPLAVRALEIALAGRAPTLPSRPPALVTVELCAQSGAPAGPNCPRRQSFALSATLDKAPCPLHRSAAGASRLPPPELEAWAERARALAMGSSAAPR